MSKFGEAALRDAKYRAEIRRFINGSMSTFFLSFFGLTSILISSKYGGWMTEALAGILPKLLSHQIELLKEIDGRSHISYVVALPLMLVVGSIYGARYFSATRRFLEREAALGSMPILPPGAVSASVAILVVGACLLLFSGTVSSARNGDRSSGVLLWPLSGLVAYTVMICANLSAVSIYILFFRAARKSGRG